MIVDLRTDFEICAQECIRQVIEGLLEGMLDLSLTEGDASKRARLESYAARLEDADRLLTQAMNANNGGEKMAEKQPKALGDSEQLDRVEAKLDWIASAVNALNIELARTHGNPFQDRLHVPLYPEPNTIPDATPLPNNTGVPA